MFSDGYCKTITTALLVLFFLLPLNLSAKDWFGTDSESSAAIIAPDNSAYTITPEELEGMLYAYADSYQASIFFATTQLIKQADSASQRQLALLGRSYSISSMYDIVTNPDPYTKLLDMVLVTTLQSYVWIDENVAEMEFGQNGQVLIDAIRQNRLAIWAIAEQVMTAEQLYLLDWLIIDWRRKHPEIDMVVYIRFADVAASRGKTIIADVDTGTGLLAPINEATKAIDEVRLLAERSFYYAKRAPLLYSWQAETVTDNLLAKPEVSTLLADVNQISDSIERVSGVLEGLPILIQQERQLLFSELDKRERSLTNLLQQVQETVGEAEHLVLAVNDLSGAGKELAVELQNTFGSLDTTLHTLDKVLTRHLGDPEKLDAIEEITEDFNIKDYTQALIELDSTVTNMSHLIDTSDDFIVSNNMTNRIRQLNSAAEERVAHATEQSNLVLGQMFFYAVSFAFIIFLFFVFYRYLSNKKIGASS